MSRRIGPLSRWAALGIVTACASYALAQATGLRLVMNGSVASSSVRMIDGRAYVPVADVAKALNMAVSKRPDGFEIVEAGGANQIEGLRGKVGDTLFDGKWRFSVLEVKDIPSYTMVSPSVEPIGKTMGDIAHFDSRTHILTPADGYRLVLIRCRIINGMKSDQNLWTAVGDVHNAIADAQGESYPPVAYDYPGAPVQTKSLLPGARTEFPVIFSLPQATQIKDLVFTLKRNDFSEKGNDVRVSLTSGGPQPASSP